MNKQSVLVHRGQQVENGTVVATTRKDDFGWF